MQVCVEARRVSCVCSYSGCEPPDVWGWEPNLGSLQEQYALLTAKPSLLSLKNKQKTSSDVTDISFIF